MFFYKEEIPTIIVPLHLTSSFNSLSFPSTCIGTSSLLSVYVTAAQLSGSTVEIVSVGDDSDQFDQTPLSFALTGGVTNQIIDITFTPTSWGLKTATVILSASNGSVINVSLEGMAAAVPLVLTSSVNSLSFGTTTVNTTTSMNVVISAGGFTSVKETVTLSDNSNQFSFSPASFELTGSGTSKTVAVTYSPTITGAVAGTLTLSSSGGNTKLISLGGSGQAPAQTDTYYANVSLLLKGDGANNSTNFVDSSANNFAISRFGNTKISTVSSPYGGSSAYFDGNGDYLSAANNAALDLYRDNFTIEMWLNPEYISGGWTQKELFGKRTPLQYGLMCYIWRNNSTGLFHLQFYVPTMGANAWQFNHVTSTFTGWTHVAFVRNGTEWAAYINGVKTVMSPPIAASFYIASNSTAFTFGALVGSPASAGYQGYMDDIRITKGAARYTANFTPPTAL